MLSLLTINWNPDPELFKFFGISIRYYGLLWIIGLALAYFIVQRQYSDRRIDEKKFEPLFFYCFFGILIGARLGHCIRLANLMNSEIIGKPTDVPWAFIFEREDMLPRHPAQLYEAIAYFIFFLGMVWLYKRGQKKQESKLETDFSTTKRKSTTVQAEASLPYHRGFFFGLCLTEIFTFRFFIEFLKENQVNFEDSMTLNMGQWLSIPFVIIGVYFMCFYGKKASK